MASVTFNFLAVGKSGNLEKGGAKDSFTVKASPGTAGPLKDNSDGSYSFTYDASSGSNSVDVTVGSSSVSGFPVKFTL